MIAPAVEGCCFRLPWGGKVTEKNWGLCGSCGTEMTIRVMHFCILHILGAHSITRWSVCTWPFQWPSTAKFPPFIEEKALKASPRFLVFWGHLSLERAGMVSQEGKARQPDRSAVAWRGMGWGGEIDLVTHVELSGGDGTVLWQDGYIFGKTQWTEDLKWVCFITSKLQLNKVKGFLKIKGKGRKRRKKLWNTIQLWKRIR